MTTHKMSCSVKMYKKSIMTAIIAMLLVCSVITLGLSPFRRASDQDALSNKAQEAFNSNNRLPDNTNQDQQQQPQPNTGQGEEHKQQGKAKGKNKHNVEDFVPIATSGNNVYLVWPTNKTTSDFEIMLKVSTDDGKTFGEKIMLSSK